MKGAKSPMADIDLNKYGISGTTEIVYNPSYEQLFKDEMDPSLSITNLASYDLSCANWIL